MRRHLKTVLHLMLALWLLVPAGNSLAAVEYGYTVLEKLAHDPQVFTQGFVLDEGYLYESSGHYGRSFVRRYPAEGNDEENQRLDLPRDVFAEGIAIVNKHLYVLSWKAGQAWVLDKDSFELVTRHGYSGEGWGLSYDGHSLILSDGTDILRLYDPDTFELTGTLKVRLNGRPVKNLNELEYHDGLIWANEWLSSRVHGINRETGEVEAILDLGELQKASAARSGESVLNGIAYDEARDAFWITGKYWNHRYLLRFESP